MKGDRTDGNPSVSNSAFGEFRTPNASRGYQGLARTLALPPASGTIDRQHIPQRLKFQLIHGELHDLIPARMRIRTEFSSSIMATNASRVS